ncbi:hypothetical protein F5Y13DRAFT_176189, partial [Hypoxylon sp. FL1857]
MSSRHTNPEDGFNKEIESRLKTRGSGRIEEWPDLYKLLFPDDEIIPEPDFIPVVEDHEVRLKNKRTWPECSQDVHVLISQQHHIPEAARSHLAQRIEELMQRHINNILERPMAIPRRIQIQQNCPDPDTQGLQPPEDEFVHIMEGMTEIGNGSSGLDSLVDTFSTPRYMSPDSSQSETQGPQQFLSSPEHMGLPSVYPTPQTAADTFGQPYPVERSSPARFEPQPGHPYYIRPPGSFNHPTIAASAAMMWPQRFQDHSQGSLSPPADIQSLVNRGIGSVEDLWTLSPYPFPAPDFG